MKTLKLVFSFVILSFLYTSSIFAQKQDSLKQVQVKYISRILKASKDTSQIVVNIMDTYKEGVKKITSDATLTEKARRAKIDDLITEKNLKLVRLLSHSQLLKIIPTTERIPIPTGK